MTSFAIYKNIGTSSLRVYTTTTKELASRHIATLKACNRRAGIKGIKYHIRIINSPQGQITTN